MSFKSTIKAMFQSGGVIEQKNSPAESQYLMEIMGLGTVNWTENSYQSNATKGYLQNVIVNKCISIISNAIGTLDWKVYNTNGDLVESGPLVDLLNRPNPEQGKTSFFTNIQMYKLIDGNSFIQLIKTGQNSPPSELYVIQPDKIKIEPGNFKIPRGYTYNDNGEQIFFETDQLTGASDILHIHTPNPIDDWRGVSQLSVAMMSVDLFNEGLEWNKKLLQNGARPLGIFQTDQELSAEQREELKLSLSQYQGIANAGKPMVTEGGLKWQEMGMSPIDIDFINGKNSAARDIANVFGVPSQLVGLPESQTYNNLREAKLELYEQVIIPAADLIMTELNHWLTPLFGDDLMIKYDIESISALIPRREEKWNMIKDADFLTIDEKREMVGLAPVESDMELGSPQTQRENV